MPQSRKARRAAAADARSKQETPRLDDASDGLERLRLDDASAGLERLRLDDAPAGLDDAPGPAAWRRTLKPGDQVDAKDSAGNWFDAVVVEVEESPGTKVKVHMNGWSSRWDSWIDRDDETSLQPLFARTDDWRKVGDVCEMRSENSGKPLWYEARVADVAGDRVQVRTIAQSQPSRWLEASSEHICRPGKASGTSGGARLLGKRLSRLTPIERERRTRAHATEISRDAALVEVNGARPNPPRARK